MLTDNESLAQQEEVKRLRASNRRLVDERNALTSDLKTLQRKLRECEVVISMLVRRLGCDVFLSMRDCAASRDKLHTKHTKQGIRLRVQKRGR